MTDGVHIRLTLTRGVKITSGMDPRLNQSGPTLIVLAEHKGPPCTTSPGSTLITSSVRRPAPDVLDPKIHHNNLLTSILAKIEATWPGRTTRSCWTAAVSWPRPTRRTCSWSPPGSWARPRAAACPEGITRAALLELAAGAGIPNAAGDYSLTQFYAADEVVRDRHHGRSHPGHPDVRAAHRIGLARACDQAPVRPVCRPHLPGRDNDHLTPAESDALSWAECPL